MELDYFIHERIFFERDDLFDFHVFMTTLEENSLGAL